MYLSLSLYIYIYIHTYIHIHICIYHTYVILRVYNIIRSCPAHHDLFLRFMIRCISCLVRRSSIMVIIIMISSRSSMLYMLVFTISCVHGL